VPVSAIVRSGLSELIERAEHMLWQGREDSSIVRAVAQGGR
jgi:hypothetical protein